ncbi:MAG TPA: acyclic terpene utilization AtuA family protein [Casimicrobiaceae bacterium]|nr:acyclic terpene utilization AtuA family protein [Casimicrobiaceae bacterium]
MAQMRNRSHYVIGSGAGFAGDRIEPAVAMAKSGEVDAIALECLAERTLINALKTRHASAESGFDPRLWRRLAPLFATLDDRCRVLTNLGAANPAAAARAARELAREIGKPQLRIAAVMGDDVADRVADVQWTQSSEGGEWIGAHAYLGIDGMAQALAEDANVVITGRVADSSLFAAAPMQAMRLSDEGLAGALTLGHLLECAGQLSGGNLTEPNRDDLSAAELANLGYPVGELERDGSAIIRLLDGAPGRVNAVACTLQLLYEVHDPRAYITPDAVLDFSSIRFEEIGTNRVRMSGARAHPRPPQLKVVGFLARKGVVADVEIGYAGTGALARARSAAEVLRLRFESLLSPSDLRIDLVGVNSVLGEASLPLRADPPEVRVHISGACADAELAQAIEDEVYTLTIAGPAGGCSVRSERRPRIETITGFIARERVPIRIDWGTA